MLINVIRLKKIEDLLSKMLWSIQWSGTALQYSPFTVLVLHTPDLTSLGMNGYTLDSTAGVWSQLVKFTLPGQLFTHLEFHECPCCLGCNIYSRLCYDYGLNDIGVTDDGRLLPSLYFEEKEARSICRSLLVIQTKWQHQIRHVSVAHVS